VSKITAAMIMGAGMGLRMRPLTTDRPKPLVMVGGKTLIDHSIDRLVAAGVSRIVVNLHYRGEMLRAHLARRRDAEIIFSDETDKLLDTGGGVVKALPLLGSAPFFVLNSDSVWVENATAATSTTTLAAMIEGWDETRMDGLLLLANMHTAMGYEGTGDFVLMADGRIARARHHAGLSAYAFPGVQIVHPRMFEEAPEGAFSTNLMWDRAIARGRLFGAMLNGVWIHVGTPEARDEAEAYLRAPASSLLA
jgi:MurNAc alpha-1-phosphate uridylyltransferase